MNYYQSIDKIRDVAEKLLLNHPLPRNEKETLLLFAISKTDKTINAIMLLCKNGMGEDAAVLGRTVFELALNTIYIFNDKTDYQAKRFFAFDWIQRKKMYEYLNEPRVSSDIELLERQKKDVEEVKREALMAQEKYKYKNSRWADKNLYEIAKCLGKENVYSTAYKIQCGIAHSSTRSMNDYLKEENGQLILNSGPSDNLIKQTLVTAFNSYYEVLVLFDEYFEKDFSGELKNLEDEVIASIK